MLLIGKKIIFALTDAFYTYERTIPQIERLIKEGAEVVPLMSFNAYNIDSKFGKAKNFVEKIEKLTGRKVIHTMEEVQELFENNFDIMIIAPCSRKYNREISK